MPQNPPDTLPANFDFGSTPDTLPANFDFGGAPSVDPKMQAIRQNLMQNMAKQAPAVDAASTPPSGLAAVFANSSNPILKNVGDAISTFQETPRNLVNAIRSNPQVAKSPFLSQLSPNDFPSAVQQIKGIAQQSPGQLVANASQMALGSKITGPQPEPVPADVPSAANILTAAARGGAKFQNAAVNVAPELEKIGTTANPQTLSDAAQAIKSRSLQLEGDYQAQLQPKLNKPVAGSGDRIAQAIEDNVTSAMQTRNPALAEKIQKLADTYRGRDVPVGELEQLRKDLSGQLDSTLAQTGLKRSMAQRDIGLKYQLDELSAVKNELYNELGPQAKAIKDTQSNLQTLQGQLEKRANQLVPQDAARQATPFSTTAAKTTQALLDLHGGTAVRTLLDRITSATGTPNAQLRSAFKMYQPAQGPAPVIGSIAAAVNAPEDGQRQR